MKSNKTCKDCGLPSHNGGVCPIYKVARGQEDRICDYFASQIQFCEICGNIVFPKATVIDMTTEEPQLICERCQSRSGTCAVCKHGNECLFQTDPSPIPPIIQKQVRQGNMIAVMDIKNPERIRQTCAKGCPCFDPETQECNKELGLCGKYVRPYEKT